MKFTGATSGSRRDTMRQRQRLHRIGAPMMRTRFPGLDSLQLNFEFSDGDRAPSPQVTVFHAPAPAYFCFACPYNDCDGEFDLSGEVTLAVHEHERKTRGQVRCKGARHGATPCTLCLDYSITPHWL